MEQNISEQIMNVINQIAEKLGVAAEKLYPILRRQATIEGLTNIFCLIAFIPMIYFMINIFKRINKDTDEDKLFPAVSIVLLILMSVAVVIITIEFAGNLIDIKNTITALFNPDWYIINNILKKLVR